jgi:hypothetical protein
VVVVVVGRVRVRDGVVVVGGTDQDIADTLVETPLTGT